MSQESRIRSLAIKISEFFFFNVATFLQDSQILTDHFNPRKINIYES